MKKSVKSSQRTRRTLDLTKVIGGTTGVGGTGLELTGVGGTGAELTGVGGTGANHNGTIIVESLTGISGGG